MRCMCTELLLMRVIQTLAVILHSVHGYASLHLLSLQLHVEGLWVFCSLLNCNCGSCNYSGCASMSEIWETNPLKRKGRANFVYFCSNDTILLKYKPARGSKSNFPTNGKMIAQLMALKK